MRPIVMPALAAGLVLGMAEHAHAQNNARAIIERAVQCTAAIRSSP